MSWLVPLYIVGAVLLLPIIILVLIFLFVGIGAALVLIFILFATMVSVIGDIISHFWHKLFVKHHGSVFSSPRGSV